MSSNSVIFIFIATDFVIPPPGNRLLLHGAGSAGNAALLDNLNTR